MSEDISTCAGAAAGARWAAFYLTTATCPSAEND